MGFRNAHIVPDTRNNAIFMARRLCACRPIRTVVRRAVPQRTAMRMIAMRRGDDFGRVVCLFRHRAPSAPRVCAVLQWSGRHRSGRTSRKEHIVQPMTRGAITPEGGTAEDGADVGLLQKSDLFALVVTPNLVNEVNYVMTTEYPAAVEQKKPVLPEYLWIRAVRTPVAVPCPV